MGNASSGSYNASQTNVNIQSMYNVTQYNNTILCNSECTNNINDVYILIENSNVGDINFDQQCNSEATCVLENDIAYINSIQQANSVYYSESSTKTAIPNTTGLSTDDVDIYIRSTNYNVQSTYVSNHINISTLCRSTVNNVQESIYIIIKNSTTGNIDFVQKGNTVLSCESVNSTKTTETVNLVSTPDLQKTTREYINFTMYIGASVVTIISIVLILFLIFYKRDINNKIEVPKTINIKTIK